MEKQRVKAKRIKALKYIIQGTYGSLKYWVQLYSKKGGTIACWNGLKDNATEFRSIEEANKWAREIRPAGLDVKVTGVSGVEVYNL